MPMVALVNPVYDCLMRLAKPDALLNEEEVSHWFFFFGFFFVGHHLLFVLHSCHKCYMAMNRKCVCAI